MWDLQWTKLHWDWFSLSTLAFLSCQYHSTKAAHSLICHSCSCSSSQGHVSTSLNLMALFRTTNWLLPKTSVFLQKQTFLHVQPMHCPLHSTTVQTGLLFPSPFLAFCYTVFSFFTHLIFLGLPWRWRQQVSLKCWYLYISVHGVIS